MPFAWLLGCLFRLLPLSPVRDARKWRRKPLSYSKRKWIRRAGGTAENGPLCSRIATAYA